MLRVAAAFLLVAAAPAAALPADGARKDSTLKPWIPDPSTGLPLQPQPQLSATCQASCYTSEVQDWGEKCKWAKVCAGCNECGVASTASKATASNATANVGANAAAASISFVTSFFVPKDPPDDYNWDHYHEIEAALAANLLNAALDEVCVVYDSVTKDDGCSALAARLGAKVDAVSHLGREHVGQQQQAVER